MQIYFLSICFKIIPAKYFHADVICSLFELNKHHRNHLLPLYAKIMLKLESY